MTAPDTPPDAPATAKPGSADEISVDIVIVGSGGCGLTAAIAAAQAGADVLILERADKPLSNTARSGGMIPAAGTRLQRDAGINETPEDFVADILAKNHHTADPERALLLARTAKDMVEWLVDDIGINLTLVDDFKYPGHTQFRMHAPPARTGTALVDDLTVAATTHDTCNIAYGAHVVDLIVDHDGRIGGVTVDYAGERQHIHAAKVILACNGYAGNTAMLRNECPEIADALYFGGEGSQGEAVLWGRSLGAATAYMDAYQGHATVAHPHGVLITYGVISHGGIHVNRDGQRFGNEMSGYSEFATAVLAQPDAIAWVIYDERIDTFARQFPDYLDAAAMGAIRAADTLDELAAITGVPADALAATVTTYNHAATGEHPDPYGRSPHQSTPLHAPYRAVKVTGALFHTQGGLVVDEHARVLRTDASVIDNLYAGGGAAAGISGHGAGGYLSGNGLLTALGYGYLAGRHAAANLRHDHTTPDTARNAEAHA